MSQIIFEGVENLKQLPQKKYLLVYDAAFDKLGVGDKFTPQAVFSDFTPNPLYEQVCRGVEIFNKTNCEMIVAIGGGSTIDVAKCIKLYCKMDASVNYLQQEKKDSEIPLVAIPTTAGTGSESTRHAVIYYNGEKQSISHESIVPNYVVLEPSFLKTLPLYQKKCTMLDALCQGIESWWAVGSTDESKQYAIAAVKGIVQNWREYVEQNTTRSAKNIMRAANYSGRAINITATTAGHAMSYKITSLYNFPHGHAVAICLEQVWEYMLNNTDKCIDKRGKEYLRRIFADIEGVISLEQFGNMLKELQMSTPQAQNRPQELKVLAQSVNPIRLKNNPVELDEETLYGLYERIVK